MKLCVCWSIVMKKTQYCDVSITIHGKAKDVDAHLFRGIAKDFTSNLSPTCCFPSGAGQTGRSANRLRGHSAKPWQGNTKKWLHMHKNVLVASFYETMTNKPPMLKFCLIGLKSREMSRLNCGDIFLWPIQCHWENKPKNDVEKQKESRVERELELRTVLTDKS